MRGPAVPASFDIVPMSLPKIRKQMQAGSGQKLCKTRFVLRLIPGAEGLQNICIMPATSGIARLAERGGAHEDRAFHQAARRAIDGRLICEPSAGGAAHGSADHCKS
jgi:hypothetical protein